MALAGCGQSGVAGPC
ncbi:hypothetical protein [Pseudosulfitobacter sp. SM2401]